VKRVDVGELRALEVGDRGGRVVYLHGFPDHPPAAHRFLEALAGHGHRVLAPWLPGYWPSRDGDDVGLVAVMDRVLEGVGCWAAGERVAFVGHDWGAVVTYLACAAHPERIARAVTLAVPHPRTFVRRLLDPRQLRASWYMALFQLPGAARIVARADFALVDRLWRAWSPGYSLPDGERLALHATLRASMPAPLTYYRRALRDARSLLARRDLRAPIRVPLLALHGAEDGCVLAPPPGADDTGRFAYAYRRETLPRLGHWLHLEAPGEIAARVDAWIREDFYEHRGARG